MQVAGIDVGSASAKAVILKDSKIISYSIISVTSSVRKVIEEVLGEALEKANLSMPSLDYVVSTGYGRNAVPFTNLAVSEILCHAQGVHFLMPQVQTIIDIGGQDSKVIRVNKNGDVINFVMNDKCAAGSGRFLEVMAQALDVKLDEIGVTSLMSKNPCNISSTCTVFAESEGILLRAEGRSNEDIMAGINKAIAKRVVIMGSGIQFEKEVVFTGGVAKNSGVKKALEEVSGMELLVPIEPQITGALGAALKAETEFTKSVS